MERGVSHPVTDMGGSNVGARVREVRSHYYDCLDCTCPTPTQAALSGGHAEEGTLRKLCNFSRPPRLAYNVGLRPRSGRFHKEKVKHTLWSLAHCKRSTGRRFHTHPSGKEQMANGGHRVPGLHPDAEHPAGTRKTKVPPFMGLTL